ncbi:MAG: hypothetical protein V3W32_01870 [Gemmatimonadota bacterium]
MTPMLGWLAAFCVFWATASLYLGGMNVELEGGSGPRQLIGLLGMLVLFLIVWRILDALLGGFGVVLPIVLSVLSLPLVARAAFALVGVKVRKGAGAH